MARPISCAGSASECCFASLPGPWDSSCWQRASRRSSSGRSCRNRRACRARLVAGGEGRFGRLGGRIFRALPLAQHTYLLFRTQTHRIPLVACEPQNRADLHCLVSSDFQRNTFPAFLASHCARVARRAVKRAIFLENADRAVATGTASSANPKMAAQSSLTDDWASSNRASPHSQKNAPQRSAFKRCNHVDRFVLRVRPQKEDQAVALCGARHSLRSASATNRTSSSVICANRGRMIAPSCAATLLDSWLAATRCVVLSA